MTRHHALVVGIDQYLGFGPEDQLFGAVSDSEVMAEVLIERHGFKSRDVLRRSNAEATREGLLTALELLRQRVERGAHVLFYFSGHGSQMTDREGDEGDGLDETLVPYDSGRVGSGRENRDITDDEINDWAQKILSVTPHLTLVFDCCHSATLHRPGLRPRGVPPDLRPVEELPPSPLLLNRDVEIGPRALLVSACRDHERAYELPPTATEPARGVFSLHFTEALRQASATTTMREIFDRTAPFVREQCPDQHPVLSGESIDQPLFSTSIHPPTETKGSLFEQIQVLPNRFDLELGFYLSRLGAWRPLPGALQFREGDRLRVDIRHGFERELFVYLFDAGLTGKLSLLFPDPHGHESLDPGVVLRVGTRPGDRLRFTMPEDMPPEQTQGDGHLIVLASPSRVKTSRVDSGEIDPQTASGLAVAYRLSRC